MNCWKILKTTHYKVIGNDKLDSLKSCGMIFLLTRGSEMDNQQVRPLYFYLEFPLNTNYLVSEDGGIYNRRRKSLTYGKDHRGYRRTSVMINGEQKALLVHRIVAMTYLPNPNNLPEVNHIDGNKANNHVSNLEWVSRHENQKHAFSIGLNSNKGVKNGKATITPEIALDLYNQMLKGVGLKELSNITGHSISILSKIKAKVTWSEYLEGLPECPRLSMEDSKKTTVETQWKIIEMKRQGLTSKGIAAELDLTVSQVEHAVTKYNKGKLQRLDESRTP